MTYITPGSLMAMAVCFLNIPTLLLMLRFVVRRLQKFTLGIDDWLIVPAWLFLMAMCVDVVTGVAYGRLGQSNGYRVDKWGFYDASGTNDNLAQVREFTWVTQILLPVVLTLSKLSVLFFYRRMLCPENLGSFHKLTKICIAVTAIWGTIFTLLEVFQCGIHFPAIFNPDSAYQCLDSKLDSSFAWSDALLDIVLLVLPVRKIMSLRLPTGKKIAIIGAFGVGGLTTAISIIRGIITTTTILGLNDNDSFDEALTYSIIVYWSLFEAGTAVIVACLPSLQYLFRRFLPEHVKKSRATAEGSGTKSSASRLKSVDILEKASVMTQSTMASRRTSMASQLPLPTFNSRPGTPAMEHPPPMPETPASRFTGFHSRTETLVSGQPSMTSGTATPVSARAQAGFHKRSPSEFKEWDGGVSPISRTSTMDSRTPLFEARTRAS